MTSSMAKYNQTMKGIYLRISRGINPLHGTRDKEYAAKVLQNEICSGLIEKTKDGYRLNF